MTTVSSDATRHDPIDEMAALYLEAHPEVRELIPLWAEDVEVDVDGSDLRWVCSLTRGEVEAGTILVVDEHGATRIDPPTIDLPRDDSGWHLMEPSALISRLRALIEDLRELTDTLEAGA